MSERIIPQSSKFDLLKRFLFNYKVKMRLNNCNNIESYLLKNNHLKTFYNKLNLIISDGFSNEVENSYFLYKGYTPDGSLTSLKKYTLINGKIEKHTDVINQDIIIIDLYEESIYLHNYSKNNDYITGYLIQEKTNSKKNKTIILSNKKVKINVKNISKFDTISVVDDFINKFII